MTKKVGRNDPCPCGSGKKYKQCCEPRLGQRRKFTASVLSAEKSTTNLKGKATKISTDFFSKISLKTPEESRKPKEDEPNHPPQADKPM